MEQNPNLSLTNGTMEDLKNNCAVADMDILVWMYGHFERQCCVVTNDPQWIEKDTVYDRDVADKLQDVILRQEIVKDEIADRCAQFDVIFES